MVLGQRLVERQRVVEIQVFLFQRKLGLLGLAQKVSQEVVARTVAQGGGDVLDGGQRRRVFQGQHRQGVLGFVVLLKGC